MGSGSTLAIAFGRGKIHDPVESSSLECLEGVGAGAAPNRVIAAIAGQKVVTRLTVQQVGILTAAKNIIPHALITGVVTPAAVDEIRAIAPAYKVLSLPPNDPIIAGAAKETVITLVAMHVVEIVTSEHGVTTIVAA